MVSTSSWLCAITILLAASVQSQAQTAAATEKTTKSPASNDHPTATGEIVAEEVIVDTSLNVRNPSAQINRRVRDVLYYLQSHESSARVKRQFGGPNAYYPNNYFRPNNYDSSQSTAQSNSHSHANGLFGSQNADALAAAQAFQTNGPLGSFGATANNANTQTLDIGPNGASGGFSNAGGQTYNLPNGQTLNIAYNNAASFNPNGNPAVSQGSSIAFNG